MMNFRCLGSCGCGSPYSVPDSWAGRTIACPNSGARVRVPARPISEADWLRGTDSQAMLLGLPAAVPARSLRLFALACCRRVATRLTHPLSRQALTLAERHADGLATDEELAALSARLSQARSRRLTNGPHADLDAAYGLTVKAFPALAASRALDAAADRTEERSAQVWLLRCVFGNPFRPAPAVDPAWLAWQGGVVRELARAAYEERRLPEGTHDPARLAVLADALEDAGCADADLLGHLRGPGPHVRGCHALNLLLGKG